MPRTPQPATTNNWVRHIVQRYRWHIVIILMAMVLSSIPQLVGWAMTPSGGRYLGRTSLAAGDTMVYYGAIQEAAEGRLFISNPFTQEPQRARLIQPLWLVQGWILRLTHLPVELLYHLGRIVTILGFVMVIWWVTRMVSPDEARRKKILILVLFSSGFGWFDYLVLRQGTSYDLWVSESNTFLTMMHSSLFMISQAAILFVIIRWWRMMEERRVVWWWGGMVAGLGMIHPYDLPTIGLACFFLLIPSVLRGTVRRSHLMNILLALAWLAPVALYYAWVLREPVLLEWAKQNVDRVGPLWRVLLGFGVWGPLAVWGMVIAWRRKVRWVLPFGAWILSVVVLMSMPGLTFQRRLINGVHIPLVLLSSVAIWQISSTWSASKRHYSWLAGVTITSFTTIVMLMHQSLAFVDPQRATYQSYLTADDQQALRATASIVPQTTAVWANPWTANALAGLYVHTVVDGHGHQTAHAAQKFQWWDDLRSAATTDAQRASIIAQSSPWLLWNPRDQRDSYTPQHDRHWQEVWRGEASVLYYYQPIPIVKR